MHAKDNTIITITFLRVNVLGTGNISTWGGLEIRARYLLFHVFEYWLWRYRYFQSKVNMWNVNCSRATAFIFDTRSCESANFFETGNISIWGGLEPPTFRFMPNALTIWAIRARHLLSHVFEYWLWWYRHFFQVKLAFEMLTVRRQQHSFSTHDRMFVWKCQSFRTCPNITYLVSVVDYYGIEAEDLTQTHMHQGVSGIASSACQVKLGQIYA